MTVAAHMPVQMPLQLWNAIDESENNFLIGQQLV
jgi:hypothetical protein